MAITIQKGTSSAYFKILKPEKGTIEMCVVNDYNLKKENDGTISLIKNADRYPVIDSIDPTTIINGDTDEFFEDYDALEIYVITNFFREAGGTAGDLYLDSRDFYGANTDNNSLHWLNDNPIGSMGNPLRTIKSNMLNTPVITFGVIGGNQIIINWTTTTNATNYVLKRNTVDAPTTATQIYTGTLLTFTDTGLSLNTEYFYYLTAQATNYMDSQLGRNNATTTATTPKSAKINLTNEANPSITPHWNDLFIDVYTLTLLDSTGAASAWTANALSSRVFNQVTAVPNDDFPSDVASTSFFQTLLSFNIAGLNNAKSYTIKLLVYLPGDLTYNGSYTVGVQNQAVTPSATETEQELTFNNIFPSVETIGIYGVNTPILCGFIITEN